MLPQNNPDRIRIVFDDHRLVANAGLLLPATLAQHLGLRELVDRQLDPGGAPGRANTGDKLLTLVASALAGGDCIDDADALRAGGTAGVLGCVVKAPSTLGTFLRSFRWGHVRQLDRVSRQLLARAWAAGAGPGDAPLTIDLDSTICETYGLAKEGARHHGYTGDVLMSRLREGRANTARGAAHFLRETVGAGALRWGQRPTHGARPTAASIPTLSSPSAAKWVSASPSPSASTKACGSWRYAPCRRCQAYWSHMKLERSDRFYVAVTRARDHLIFCHPIRSGPTQDAKPSRFLLPIGDMLRHEVIAPPEPRR